MPPTQARLQSLDALRGITIASMILVTDPGTYAARYWPLCHADWLGGTPTDLIFPAFLVMTGIAMTLSFASRRERGDTSHHLLGHVLRRTILLLLLGLFLNAFPTFALHTVRIPGILQRIAVCYMLGSLLYFAAHTSALRTRLRPPFSLALAATLLLFTCALLLLFVPVPGFPGEHFTTAGNIGAYLDRQVFGIRHLWPYGTTPGLGVTFDPEGLLSTLGALATTLLGVIAGEWLRTTATPARKATSLALASCVLIAAGFALSPILPIIKKIWTPSFALISAGAALLLLAALYAIIDIRRIRFWTPPALIFGTNAILAFAISTIITTLLDFLHISGITLTCHKWGYQHLFLPWLSPIHASLAYAFGIVLLNLLLLLPLYRRNLFLRL